MLSGANPEKINLRMNEIRESLSVINMVSLAEALAYQELGETSAARKSLMYYAEFVKKTYLEIPGLVERLDLIDSAPENYWSEILPNIEKQIEALPCNWKQKVLEEGEDENGKTV